MVCKHKHEFPLICLFLLLISPLPQLANLPLLFIQHSIHSIWKTPEVTEGKKRKAVLHSRPDYAKLCGNSAAAALENSLGGGNEKASHYDLAHSWGYNLDLTSIMYFI